jgi:phenylacetate-CoA ligase
VVVTDLYNHAMPLIRYDIGDLAVSPDEPGRIRRLTEFAGRQADCVYSPSGLMVSSVAVSGITEVFTTMAKYQMIQETQDTYTFQYVGTLSEEDQAALDGRLHDSLSADAKITYLNVADIPVGKNGKYKTLVNRYKA